MFRRMLIFSGMLLAAAAVLLLAFLVHIPKEDYALYEQILRESDPTTWPEEHSEQTGHQDRQIVDKQLWIKRGGERRYCLLQAQSSRLIYTLQGERVDLVEELEDVKGWMQEELFFRLIDGREALLQRDGKLLLRNANPEDTSSYISRTHPGLSPWQQVRKFNAAHATYTYRAQELKAQNCHIIRSILPGHRMPGGEEESEVLMKGVAHTITFTLEDDSPYFQAEGMRASIYSERGIR